MDTNVPSRFIYSAELFLTLILFWILLNGNLESDTLLIGLVAAFVITVFFRNGLSFLSDYRLVPAAIPATLLFILYFLKELVKSNFRLAFIVLSPSLPVNPGIVKVRTKLQSRMGRLLLANAITLTPGTLTVELQDEWLYVHWVSMETADVDQATETIVAGFERYLEVMYG
ncbi:Na+/H+ antiporter subunit E [Magnetospira sp. QH-2]|uniref:Na+/H+ antiporter subunit E n=1 Tax=Magnetospira sp. (strain QH-2) TaxID=1288970 RepID=UPI0003E80C6D|nr:Na+/H+ antiporter subunit E [Magnetospira sp. QH-2]CCQ75312.1 putative Na+/H+ antiporter, MnhE subunit [Magnetospira sp. QH-2]